MLLDLRDLDSEGLRFGGPLALPDLPLQGDERVGVKSATIDGTVTPLAFGAELRARLRARLELACVRCLEPYEVAIDLPVLLILTPGGAEASGDAEEEPDEDAPDPASLYPVPDGILDLVAVAREQVYLALPLKPVCTETCRGLCPTCGANRNRIECACSSEVRDPRLAPLLDIRKRLRER
jgi:uncharacterized protein